MIKLRPELIKSTSYLNKNLSKLFRIFDNIIMVNSVVKVILTGNFSNYELHCEVNGDIYLLNKKAEDQGLQRLGTFRGDRGLQFSYRDRYKNLKKWLERKSKMVPGVSYNNNEQQNSNAIQSFYGVLKGEVRGYKLKEEFKEELN